MLLCTAKEVIFKQTALNNILHTEVSSQLVYSLSTILFSAIFFDKALRLLLTFVHGICPLSNWLFLVAHEPCYSVFQLLNA